MSVHRIMGIETEYGISVPGRPHVNAMMASSQVVNAYAAEVLGDRQSRARWDYDEESPLRDARGFDQSRAEADPSQLTDEDLGLANVILTNGARLYVDHAHPLILKPDQCRDLFEKKGFVVERMSRGCGDFLSTWGNGEMNNFWLRKKE